MEIISEPEFEIRKYIDYDLTLQSGVTVTFSLRPDLGDTEETLEDGTLKLTFRTGHEVKVNPDLIAIASRQPRELKFVIPSKKKADNGTT